jgi:hypothetical protein
LQIFATEGAIMPVTNPKLYGGSPDYKTISGTNKPRGGRGGKKSKKTRK